MRVAGPQQRGLQQQQQQQQVEHHQRWRPVQQQQQQQVKQVTPLHRPSPASPPTLPQWLTQMSHTLGRVSHTRSGPPLPPPPIPRGSELKVLGLSQAMVDFTAEVPDSFLTQWGLTKGERKVISLQERHEVIERLDTLGCASQVSPGGSVANTLVAIARLSVASGGSPMRVSMTGSVGTDALGCYFNAQMKKAGVHTLVDPDSPSHTGTVMVLTTPDAQRSFLSFFDTGHMRLTPHLARAIAASHVLVIEGYMLEVPGAEACVRAVASLARGLGVQVALTAGDPGVVSRHKAAMQALLHEGLVDVLFCNCDEANQLLGPGDGGRENFAGGLSGSGDALAAEQQQQQLVDSSPGLSSSTGSGLAAFGSSGSLEAISSSGSSSSSSSIAGGEGGGERGARTYSAPQAVAALAAYVPLVVVTDGSRGSCVGVQGQVYCLDLHRVGAPVDVCGAGDAYAAGILFAMLQGHDMHTAGRFAARAAAAVVGRHGAQLAESDAAELVGWLPNHVLLPAHWPKAPAGGTLAFS